MSGFEDGRWVPEPRKRLVRQLGLGDAVVLGLGSMLGAGVFAAFGPAARAAGAGLLLALLLAAVIAYANATASAQLATPIPVAPTFTGAAVWARCGGSSPAGDSWWARPQAARR